MTSFGLLLAAASLLPAQDVTSGPNAGDKVPALKVHDLTGEHKEKEIDYAAERKDRPTVYLFVNGPKFDRPMNRFMKELDKVLKKEFEGTYAVAVVLAEAPDEWKERLPRVQTSVQYESTALTVFPGDKAGPKDWNVNADAHLTVVVANKGKVTATFGYQSVNETDVPKVKEAVAKAIKDK